MSDKPAAAGSRLYDVNTDRFITNRAQIIDKLVEWAANLVTLSERREQHLLCTLSPPATAFLAAALTGWRERAALGHVVAIQWRALVS